jgi:hypothetical protein
MSAPIAPSWKQEQQKPADAVENPSVEAVPSAAVENSPVEQAPVEQPHADAVTETPVVDAGTEPKESSE